MQMNSGCEKYKSILSSSKTILRTEGVKGFYVGYKPCVALDCSYAALQFSIYESLRKYTGNVGHLNQTLKDIVYGAVSGGLAAFLTNPIDVVVNRLMLQQLMFDGTLASSTSKLVWYNSSFDCLSKIWKQERFQGLYRGSSTRILSIMPLSGLTFAVYEKTKAFLCLNQDCSFNDYFN